MNTSHVTLRQLRAFTAIADTGSFAAAARQMHLTPSALSLLIKELESGMKVRLFDRTTRSTALSLAGSEFYPLARKVLDDLALALETTQDLEQKKRGTVRIACTPLYASTTLPELILRYRELYPAVAVYVLDSLNQQATLIHELVHVWQAQQGVNLLMAKLRAGDSKASYAYPLDAEDWAALNIEQQAMAVEHRFRLSRGARAPCDAAFYDRLCPFRQV